MKADPTITVKVNVADLKIADILAWLCQKADEENRAQADGSRDHALYWTRQRAEALPKLIEELRGMRFDLDELQEQAR